MPAPGGIPLSSNFDVQTPNPLDHRTVASDIADRDSLTSVERYEGLIVYVKADDAYYWLVGGITNSDWQAIWGWSGGWWVVLANQSLTAGTNTIAHGQSGSAFIAKVVDNGTKEVVTPTSLSVDATNVNVEVWSAQVVDIYLIKIA